jgi:catechol-2,3-dioxygenase
MAASNRSLRHVPGLDHLAFTVADREELGAWVMRLGNA